MRVEGDEFVDLFRKDGWLIGPAATEDDYARIERARANYRKELAHNEQVRLQRKREEIDRERLERLGYTKRRK